ncbi:MAG TPA: hypothetical protein VMX58_11135 [Patescibacteria group bacterium]|nr:hypothetical protein [Patescibacteria group bacterium]
MFPIIISSAACNAEATIDVDDVLEDLLYEDLVVEGEVCGISEITVPSRDFFVDLPHGPDEIFAVFDFKVKNVLIGDWDEEFVPIVGFTGSGCEYHFDLEENDTYILALRRHHGGKGAFESIRYILRRDAGRFLVRDGNFIRGWKKFPMQHGELADLYDAIRKVRERRSIKTISREAEIIARGTVIEVRETDEMTAEGYDMRLCNVKLNIASKIKGNIEGDTLTIGMIQKGLYWPNWRVKVPDMNKGEEWYVFLKWNDEIGYYPFAGVNGLFRVEGDRLIRDNHNMIYLKYDPASFENEIFKSIQE